MNLNISNKKISKKPKLNALQPSNPETSKIFNNSSNGETSTKPNCPLLAKDSEWVDILQTTTTDSAKSSKVSDEEQVESEDGPDIKPLAILFPGLLDRDPETLQGVIDKAMSTTEVTKHLVDLGQKANFTFMKTANKLIPRDKEWLEKVIENKDSNCSMVSKPESSSSIDYEADTEISEYENSNITMTKNNDGDCNTSSKLIIVKIEEKPNK